MQMDYQDTVIQALSAYTDIPPSKISTDAPLEMLGLDSLDLVAFSMELEEIFGDRVSIGGGDFDSIETVRDVIAHVEKRCK